MPKYLTAAAGALALWVAAWGIESGEVLAELLPGALAVPFVLADYALWRAWGRPWHAWPVILLVLPPIACAVWIAVGGLVLEVDRTREGLLGIEVGPGVALTGLLCTLISYHGRHHPYEDRGEGRPLR